MIKKIRWGVLGTANIAVKKVIPAIQDARFCVVAAIASRSQDAADEAARGLGISQAYGSYEDLLADPGIDAVYIPLPNNMHLEWTEKAALAGKHVMCEKPIGIDAGEVRRLIGIRDHTKVKIQEAFMVRDHPQWQMVREMVRSGRIGDLKAITGFFSYFNDDGSNIRNQLKMGGGGLLDIGCYCINIARFIFGSEPGRVSGLINRDPENGIDNLTTAILDFPAGHSSFTCSTLLVPYQRMQFLGTSGRIEVQIPFNIPTKRPNIIRVDDGKDLSGGNIQTIEVETANQYTIQFELFSKAILENSEQSIALEDSLKNMLVIDAVFRSAASNDWETVLDS